MGAISTLGGLASSPIATGLGVGLSAFNTAAQYQNQQQSVDQLRQRQRQEEREAQQRSALELEKLEVEKAQAEEDRLNSLKRAVARSRANSSARGVSTTGGGSSDAVLLGLHGESEEDRQRREELDKIRTQSIEQSLDSVQQNNLLELSQAKSRNNVFSFL